MRPCWTTLTHLLVSLNTPEAKQKCMNTIKRLWGFFSTQEFWSFSCSCCYRPNHKTRRLAAQSQAKDPISCHWLRTITDARRKNASNSAFMEWSFPWYALSASSNNCLRTSSISYGIQTITFNEGLLSRGCHQVVVIRSQVTLRQLELGRVQTAPEKGSEVQSRGQNSCLAPPCDMRTCHSSAPWVPSHRHGRPQTHLAQVFWSATSFLRMKRQLKKKKKKKYETQAFQGAFPVTCTAGKLLFCMFQEEVYTYFPTVYWSSFPGTEHSLQMC